MDDMYFDETVLAEKDFWDIRNALLDANFDTDYYLVDTETNDVLKMGDKDRVLDYLYDNFLDKARKPINVKLVTLD